MAERPLRVLITGVAGSGKSTVADSLAQAGQIAYSIEDMPDMFRMWRRSTGEPLDDYDNTNEQHLRDSVWRCDIEKLHHLLAKHLGELVFCCGVASNFGEVAACFDEVLLLVSTPTVIYDRLLTNREGKNEMGGSETSRQEVLGYKDGWEQAIISMGATVIHADGTPQEVTELILQHVNASAVVTSRNG